MLWQLYILLALWSLSFFSKSYSSLQYQRLSWSPVNNKYSVSLEVNFKWSIVQCFGLHHDWPNARLWWHSTHKLIFCFTIVLYNLLTMLLRKMNTKLLSLLLWFGSIQCMSQSFKKLCLTALIHDSCYPIHEFMVLSISRAQVSLNSSVALPLDIFFAPLLIHSIGSHALSYDAYKASTYMLYLFVNEITYHIFLFALELSPC